MNAWFAFTTSWFRKFIRTQTETGIRLEWYGRDRRQIRTKRIRLGERGIISSLKKARAAYLAALRALDIDDNDVNPLLEFARS